jgi:hypothetical protein
MTQDEIIEMAKQAGLGFLLDAGFMCHQEVKDFAKLIEEHVRNTMNEEAKTHLEELRKNFNVESAELSMHKWIKERYT